MDTVITDIDAELERIGRFAISAGQVKPLREKYKLSVRRLAEILNTASQVVNRWELDSMTSLKMRQTSAIRLGRLVVHEIIIAGQLAEQGIMVEDLVPLSRITSELGLSPSSRLIAEKCRSGELSCFDLGRFGIYIPLIEARSVLHKEIKGS